MATSVFKSTTKRASIGGSSSEDSGSRSLRRFRSLSRFSRPITAEPETEMDYHKNVPRGEFVNTTRGSTVPFQEISLDDLALEFFSSSSKNESDGGVVERNERGGRSVSRRGEIGRLANDTASSRRRGRSVSKTRADAASSSSALWTENLVSSDTNSRRRRSLSVARSRGNAVSSESAAGAKKSTSSNMGSRRRRSLSVARYQISDSESEVDHSRHSSDYTIVKAPISGTSQMQPSSKVTTSSNRRFGKSQSYKDLSLIQDGYSSHSSALTDDESKDTHFWKKRFEKISRPVYAPKKPEHPSVDAPNGRLYEVMREELRHAVDEIRTELNQSSGRNRTALPSDDCMRSENPKTVQNFSRTRGKDAQKLEQLEKRKHCLPTDMLLKEHRGREVSQNHQKLSNLRPSVVVEKPSRSRKRSSDRSRMTDILNEDAERYFEDFIYNIEDTDMSSFDGERSDGSSTLGGTVKATRYAQTYNIRAESTQCPIEMDGVVLPWLQWETSHDGSLSGNSKAQTQRDSEKETSQSHDPSSYSTSSHGSSNPGIFHTSPSNKREDCTSRFNMDAYLNLSNNEDILFELYRERNRINSGGLLLCAGIIY